MLKTTKDYLGTLVSLCSEALQLHPKDKIQPLQVSNNIKATQTIFQNNVEWKTLYEEYKDVLLSGERPWFLENEFLIGDLDVGYCIAFAEKEDPDLSTSIIYHVYMCIKASGVVTDEEELSRLGKISSVLKSLVNDKDSTSFGPTGIDFNAMKNGMPDLTNILSNFMPAMQNMMASNELKEFMKTVAPTNVDSTQPPDISQILNKTVTGLSTDAGKDFINKLTMSFGDVMNKK